MTTLTESELAQIRAIVREELERAGKEFRAGTSYQMVKRVEPKPAQAVPFAQLVLDQEIAVAALRLKVLQQRHRDLARKFSQGVDGDPS